MHGAVVGGYERLTVVAERLDLLKELYRSQMEAAAVHDRSAALHERVAAACAAAGLAADERYHLDLAETDRAIANSERAVAAMLPSRPRR